LLTVGYDGDPELLRGDLVAYASALLEAGGASRAAVDVRAHGDEVAPLAAADTERDASAVIALWDVESPELALKFPLPDGVRLVGAYRVEEVVQKDYEQTWPAGEMSPGVKLCCFVRRKPDISHDEYSAHWRENHGPLAVARQPGFWHYTHTRAAITAVCATQRAKWRTRTPQTFPVRALVQPTVPYPRSLSSANAASSSSCRLR
jgi:hypothetical protein